MIKKIIIVATFLIMLPLLYFVGEKAIFKFLILPKNQILRYEKNRDSLILNNKPQESKKNHLIDSNSIVFAGSSRTALFAVEEYFSNGEYINCGVYSNVSFGLLMQIHEIANKHPAKIFIEIGINDILFGFPKDSVFSNLSKTLDVIHSISPKSKVYCQSILPVGSKDAREAKNINQIILEVNSVVSQICKERQVKYIDLNQFFSKKGILSEEYDSGDKLHLNSNAYQKWSELLSPYVYE